MKTLKSFSAKKTIFGLLLMVVSIQNSSAINAVDSDLSNFAGSNEGRDQLGMYIFVVLLLVLSVVLAYREKKSV
jgi:hypothetical protein